jgi:hypothetical protein
MLLLFLLPPTPGDSPTFLDVPHAGSASLVLLLRLLVVLLRLEEATRLPQFACRTVGPLREALLLGLELLLVEPTLYPNATSTLGCGLGVYGTTGREDLGEGGASCVPVVWVAAGLFPWAGMRPRGRAGTLSRYM